MRKPFEVPIEKVHVSHGWLSNRAWLARDEGRGIVDKRLTDSETAVVLIESNEVECWACHDGRWSWYPPQRVYAGGLVVADGRGVLEALVRLAAQGLTCRDRLGQR